MAKGESRTLTFRQTNILEICNRWERQGIVNATSLLSLNWVFRTRHDMLEPINHRSYRTHIMYWRIFVGMSITLGVGTFLHMTRVGRLSANLLRRAGQVLSRKPK